MSMDDDEVMFSMGDGCLAHGDEHMLECSMCGVEFCTKCFPESVVCEDCSADPDGHLLDEDLDVESLADDDEEDDALLDGIEETEDEDPDDPDDNRR